MFERRRKTKEPCPVCRLHIERCLCALLPSLDLRTRVTLVIHHRELKRTTNTGQLATRALVNSRLVVRGLPGQSLQLGELLAPEYHSVLLFPGEGSAPLSEEVARAQGRPLHLIVPDGNWRQASKVHSRHSELAHLPRVTVPVAANGRGLLRKEHFAEGMATLQAIAQALTITESSDAGNVLHALYEEKVRRTLAGRGVKNSWCVDLNSAKRLRGDL